MIRFLVIFLGIGLFTFVWGQQGNSPQQAGTAPKLIKLGPIKIKARIELPTVTVLDKRIPPEFQEVKAEKSFVDELQNSGEILQFSPVTSGKVSPIPNIEALLNKKRF